jgi:hypothetical protein
VVPQWSSGLILLIIGLIASISILWIIGLIPGHRRAGPELRSVGGTRRRYY